MRKQLVLLSTLAALAVGVLGAAPALAVVTCPSGELAETEAECALTDSRPSNPVEYPSGTIVPSDGVQTPATDAPAEISEDEIAESATDEGAEESEDEEEEDGEVAMWTVYLSVGALAATLLIVIILAITNRSRK